MTRPFTRRTDKDVIHAARRMAKLERREARRLAKLAAASSVKGDPEADARKDTPDA